MARKKLFVGSREVKKRYIGSRLVWSLETLSELGRLSNATAVIGQAYWGSRRKPTIQIFHNGSLPFDVNDIRQLTISNVTISSVENVEKLSTVIKISIDDATQIDLQRKLGSSVRNATVIFYS